MDGGNSDMTLAFELEALKEVRSPEAVFTDARQWTEYVGVISDKPTYVVTNFTRKNRIRQDFFSGPRSRKDSLANVKVQFESDRYVFVGTNEDDKALAEEVDWEYLAIEDAAEAAGWDLALEEEDIEFEDDSHDDWP